MPTTAESQSVAFTLVDSATGKVLSAGTAKSQAAALARQAAGQAVIVGASGRPGIDFYDPKFRCIREIPQPSTRDRLGKLEAAVRRIADQAGVSIDL